MKPKPVGVKHAAVRLEHQHVVARAGRGSGRGRRGRRACRSPRWSTARRAPCAAAAGSASSSAAALPTSPRSRRHRRSSRCRRPTSRSGRRRRRLRRAARGRESRRRRWPSRRRAGTSPPSSGADGPSCRGPACAAAGRRLRPMIAAAGICGCAVGVAQRAGVRRAQSRRADGADERGDRAERRGARRPVDAELHGLAVGRERHVEEDDPALDAIARRASSSSKLWTTSTSASMPSGGVPTLLPRPSIDQRMPVAARRSPALSRPRTQCGTLTGSVCTFSRPSFFISLDGPLDRGVERSREPLRRWPNVSPSTASRSQANDVEIASAISRGRARGRRRATETARTALKRSAIAARDTATTSRDFCIGSFWPCRVCRNWPSGSAHDAVGRRVGRTDRPRRGPVRPMRSGPERSTG